MSVYVTKADGTQELFVVGKLKRSLRRAGATKQETDDVIRQIEAILHDGIKTQAIYRKAFELLRDSDNPRAARYSMRRALFNLGPTGFPFEDFLSRLFQAEGYQTKTRITLRGKCAQHELDVAAYNETEALLVEAKFHSRPGVKSDLQVALYTQARALDLRGVKICKADHCGVGRVLLVTNTKFTRTAERYAECAGLELLSWTYPKDNNLQDRIERAGIYPITVLSTLSQKEKRTLIEAGVIICKDLLRKPHTLNILGLSPKKTNLVLEEARQLCAS